MDGCRVAGSAHRAHTLTGLLGTGGIMRAAGTGLLGIGEADQVPGIPCLPQAHRAMVPQRPDGLVPLCKADTESRSTL
jgi:hypothetical protein